MKPYLIFSKNQEPLTFIAETNLQIIMKMKIIDIVSVILDPFLTKQCKNRTPFRHFVIPELHFGFSFFCQRYSSVCFPMSAFQADKNDPRLSQVFVILPLSAKKSNLLKALIC